MCHLTMYSENLLDVIDKIRVETNRIMVVVGAEDWNIAVGNQPHSEIAALALFLDYLQQGKELKAKFEHAKREIVPKRVGKEMKEKVSEK